MPGDGDEYVMGEEVTDFDIYNPKQSQKAPTSPTSNKWMNSPPEQEHHYSIATQSQNGVPNSMHNFVVSPNTETRQHTKEFNDPRGGTNNTPYFLRKKIGDGSIHSAPENIT